MMGNSKATPGWMDSLCIGSEVYAAVYSGGMWGRSKEGIYKITGETPKRWKVGDVQFSKHDGYGFHGSFISEVTDDHRKAARVAALLKLYQRFRSKIESTQYQVAQLQVDDIEIITSKLEAVVDLIEDRTNKNSEK